MNPEAIRAEAVTVRRELCEELNLTGIEALAAIVAPGRVLRDASEAKAVERLTPRPTAVKLTDLFAALR